MKHIDQSSLSKLLSRLFYKLLFKVGISILCTYSVISQADYKQVIEEDFWNKVYSKGGSSFYCDSAFDKPSPIITVSHIYPTEFITKEFDCRSERSCLRSSPKFEQIMSDLHNMVPINSIYHFKMKGSVFGILDESDDGDGCGLKKRYNIIEPPDQVKGDIARIHFYMHTHYNLPLNNSFLFLKTWAKEDPPSKEEIEKNNRIKEIQGNDNPYITDPSLVDQLEF